MAVEPDEFERIINKKWGDLKHIETERHWFLGFFALAVAGILAFLAQNADARVIGVWILAGLSFFGLLQAWQAGRALAQIQDDIKNLVGKWENLNPTVEGFWKSEWNYKSIKGPYLQWGFFDPKTFTGIGTLVYVPSLVLSLAQGVCYLGFPYVCIVRVLTGD